MAFFGLCGTVLDSAIRSTGEVARGQTSRRRTKFPHILPDGELRQCRRQVYVLLINSALSLCRLVAGLLILQYNIAILSIANTIFSIAKVLQYFLKICIGIGIANTFFLVLANLISTNTNTDTVLEHTQLHNRTVVTCGSLQFKTFGPYLPLLFKMHEIWSDDSQENY